MSLFLAVLGVPPFVYWTALLYHKLLLFLSFLVIIFCFFRFKTLYVKGSTGPQY